LGLNRFFSEISLGFENMGIQPGLALRRNQMPAGDDFQSGRRMRRE
jgi:hypothetical protein